MILYERTTKEENLKIPNESMINQEMMWKEEYKKAIDDYDINTADRIKLNVLKGMEYRLYRYRSFDEKCLNEVKKQQMWMALPNTFNDPLEFLSKHKHSEEVKQYEALLPKFRNRIPEVEKYLDHVEKERNKTLKSFSVCCFMEENASYLMWSHYGDGHKGFCIEYDFSEDKFNRFVYPVCYREKVFELDLSIKNVDFLPVMISKMKDWSYEKEWRIILSDDSKGLQTSPNIKAVYLGLCVTDENKERMIEVCREKGIALFQMEVVDDTYNLKPKKIIY